MADNTKGMGAEAKEAYDNAFRRITKEDEVQRILSRIREVSKTSVSSSRFIKKRILAQGQFLSRQTDFFGLGEGQVERGLTANQHKRVFNVAMDQAFGSFAPEDRTLLDSVLISDGGKGFAQLGANNKLSVLQQALREGKQSKLLVQLVNRGRRSIRPTARHFQTHYGDEAVKPYKLTGAFPDTLGMSIPGVVGQEAIKTKELDPIRHATLGRMARDDAGLAKEFARYFEGMRGVGTSSGGEILGSHRGFSQTWNEEVTKRFGRGHASTGAYQLQFSYKNKDVTLRIPMITQSGKGDARIGFTGDNLNVRRIMTPVRIVDTTQELMTHSIMQRNQYFLTRFNEEIVPLMQEGRISGSEVQKYAQELHGEVFTGEEVSSGRAHTSMQSFMQRRYEREIGAAAQLVTRSTDGLRKGNIPLAFAGLSDQQMLGFLDVHRSDFGIDVSENRFAKQGMVAIKSGKKVGGRAIDGDLTAREFSDVAITEHSRLDQKIRRRTMSAESVVSANKGARVQQREWDAFGRDKMRQHVQRLGKRFQKKLIDYSKIEKWHVSKDVVTDPETGKTSVNEKKVLTPEWKRAQGLERELERRLGGLTDMVESKRLNFDDLDSLKEIFGGHAADTDHWKTVGAAKKFTMLENAIVGMEERPDQMNLRKGWTRFLSDQEKVLYGMADVDEDGNLKGFATIDNKAMLPAGEARYDGLSKKRLLKARGLITDLQRDIISKGALEDAYIPEDYRTPTGRVDTVKQKQAYLKLAEEKLFKKYGAEAAGDAAFLIDSTEQLPYYKKQSKAELTKKIANQLGIGDDFTKLAANTAEGGLENARAQLAKREEVLQVGTMYVDPKKIKAKVATKYFGSGEGIMRDRMKHMLSQETTSNKSLAKLNPAAFQLAAGSIVEDGHFKAGGFKKDAEGNYMLKEDNLKMRNSIIAWDSKGREVLFDKKMRNIQFTEMDANDKSATKWLLMEYDELIRPESHVKLFGDIKQGVSFVKGGVKGWKAIAFDLAKNMSRAGRAALEFAGESQTIENITELQFGHGKRAQQHIRQIATAMSMTIDQHVQGGGVLKDQGLKNMGEDPFNFTRSVFQLGPNYSKGAKQGHTDQVQKMLNWYMEKAFQTGEGSGRFLRDQKKFSRIFGLTESVFGSDKFEIDPKTKKRVKVREGVETMIEKALDLAEVTPAQKAKVLNTYIKEASSGAAMGVARQFMGDAMSMQGAGKMGTLEGRSLMIMGGSQFGERGEEIGLDYLKRMKAFDMGAEGSEKWKVREELQRSMKTIIEPSKIPKGAAIIDLTGDIETSQMIKKMSEQGENALATGQDMFLKIGDNKGIYVPTMSMPGMAEKTIETMRGDIKASAILRNAYGRFISDIADGTTHKEALGSLQDTLMPHAAEFSKGGMGGVLKGSLPGSRGLIASSRSAAGETIDAANVVGISKKHANRMITEMIDTGLYSEEQVSQLRSQFARLEAGGTVGGTISRHPFISSYSIQKTLFKLIDDPGDVIVMPEISVDIGAGTTEAPKMRLKLGSMLGLAGDYDFDTIIAAFVDPESEKVISKEMDFKHSSEYYERYIQHQVRYQKLAIDESDMSKQILSNVESAAGKMQVKEAYVGKLSNEMTKVKFAAASYLGAEKAADVFALTEWLEQKPISAKHLNPKDLEVAMSNLVGAFQGGARDHKKLYNAISSFIDTDSAKDIVLSREDVAAIKEGTGYNIAAKANKKGQVIIKGFDLEELAKDIFRAQTLFRKNNGPENLSTMKGTTKGAAAAKSFQKLHAATKAGMGRAASIADQVMTNLMGAAGDGTIYQHKGIKAAMAIGSLVGLANILSQPKEMVGPGKHLDSRARMNMSKGTKRIKKDDVKPPRAPIGTPTSQSMLSQRRAMIAAKPVETNHYVVRARAEYPEDVALISQQLQQFTSLGNSVNISLRDSRGISNRYADSNKAY